MRHFIVFVQNVTLLISLIVIYNLIIKRWDKKSIEYVILSGVLFGLFAVMGMTMPLTLTPGVIFDGRTIIHNMAGLFGGHWVALIAALISSSYRYYIGGAGVLVGILNIVQSSLFGILFRYLNKRNNLAINTKSIVLLSFLTNIVMLILFTNITNLTPEIVAEQLLLPIMLIYPLATFIIASLIMRQENEFTAQKALKQSEALKSSIINAVPDLLIRFDRQGTYLDVLTDDESRLIKPRNELIGKKLSDVMPTDLTNNTLECIETSLTTGKLQTMEYSLVTMAGFLEFESRTLPCGDNEVLTFIRDITERKLYEKRLEYYSIHDYFTGLYNRAHFEEMLTHFHIEKKYPISVISVDIDGLKLINDTMGHNTGNEALLTLREIFKDSLRAKDILARVDGDEYAAILPFTDYELAECICDRILKGVSKYNDDQKILPFSISLGLATVLAPDNKAPLDLLTKAEEAMYRNKIPHQSSRSNRVVQALIAALSERDYITDGHADRVQRLCLKLGEKMGLSSGQLSDLALLSRVHDLGKVGIPDKILFKPTKLDQEEWEIMRQHPEKGYRIASASIDLAAIAPLILKHHEHWNGNGYPLKLNGEEIPIECRILSIVDAYDAMTNDRPYSKAITHEKALTEIKRCSGHQFDPVLADIFIDMVNREKILV